MVAGCAVEWRGVPVKQAVSGSFWVVSDDFCWFQLISDGFRWFAVLVVTPIHNIQKSYFFTILMNPRDWLNPFDFFIQSKTIRKILLLSCCLAAWKQVIIYYTLWCSISNKKHLLKENSHKTQSKWSIANYLRRGVLAGSVRKLFKNGEYLH